MSNPYFTRYFTRDCKACPFWEPGRCTMTKECTTFKDLFSGGTFHSTLDVLQTLYNNDDDEVFQGGYYVDCDGILVDKVCGSELDVATYLGENPDIVGILIPKDE